VATGETVEREVEIGLSNEKVVEIKAGLEEGEEVVLNPRALLSDKEKAKLPSANDKTGPANSEPNKARNGHNPGDKSGQASTIKPGGEAKLNKNTHSVNKP
jgi:hypothetical protein